MAVSGGIDGGRVFEHRIDDFPAGIVVDAIKAALPARVAGDADVIILMVEQLGGIACHTGRQSCFYRVYDNASWKIVEPVLKDPAAIYATGHSHE